MLEPIYKTTQPHIPEGLVIMQTLMFHLLLELVLPEFVDNLAIYTF
jgi:hypothetical protein